MSSDLLNLSITHPITINHTSNNCRSLESEAPGPRHFSTSIIQVTQESGFPTMKRLAHQSFTAVRTQPRSFPKAAITKYRKRGGLEKH